MNKKVRGIIIVANTSVGKLVGLQVGGKKVGQKGPIMMRVVVLKCRDKSLIGQTCLVHPSDVEKRVMNV